MNNVDTVNHCVEPPWSGSSALDSKYARAGGCESVDAKDLQCKSKGDGTGLHGEIGKVSKFDFFLANAEKQETFPKFEDFEDDYFLPFRAQEIVPNVGCGREPSLCISAGLDNSWPLPTNMKNKWIILLIWICDTSYEYIYIWYLF